MTRKQANEIMTILTARAAFVHYAAPHCKDDFDRMRAFVIAALKAGGIRGAARMYDRVAAMRREDFLGLVDYPEILELHAANPIWKEIGVKPPWTEQ